MKKSGSILLAFVFGFFFACGDSSDAPKKRRIALQNRIHQMRDSLVTDGQKAEYVELVDSLSKDRQTDSSMAGDLLKAAKICTKKGEYGKATELRTRYVQQFPKGLEIPEQLFAIGFSYHNDLKQLDSAKKYFELMIVDYPDHKLTEFAKFELKHLGENAEDIVKGFKEKNGMQN